MELHELSRLSGREDAGEGVDAPGNGLAKTYVVVLGPSGDGSPELELGEVGLLDG